MISDGNPSLIMTDRPVLTLYPKKSRTCLLLLTCCGLTGLGVWMGLNGEWMGWAVAGFFVFGVPTFAVQFVPGCAFLTIDAEGFEFASLFRRRRIAWSDISEFGILTVQSGTRMVGFNYVPDYPHSVKARAFSRAFTGCEGGLPDTYGMSVEELADLLNRARDASLPRTEEELPDRNVNPEGDVGSSE